MSKLSKRNIIIIIAVFTLLYIAYSTVYMSRQNLSVATPGLTELSIMTKLEIGTLGTIFSVIYAIGRLINGRLGDKIHPKIMISTGLILVAASNFAFGFFPGYIWNCILWGINAWGQTMLWGSILRVMAKILPEDKRTKIMSYYATSVSFGVVLGIFVCTGAISFGGVSYAFFVPAAFALIFAVLCFIFVGRFKFDKPVANTAETEGKLPVKKQATVLQLLHDKQILSVLIPTMLHGVIKENINLWLSLYFVTRFQINLSDSLLFVLAIPMVGVVGRMFYPLIYSKLGKSEANVNMFAFSVMTVFTVPLVFIPNMEQAGVFFPVLAAVCLGMISACISVINHSMLTFVPMKYAKISASSTVAGITDFLTYLGAGIGSVIYGAVFEAGFDMVWMFISWIVLNICAFAITFFTRRNIRKIE